MNTNKYEAVVEAARKIRHWHDAMNGEGMIVSSEAVREIWKALEELDNDYILVPVEEPCCPISGMTEEQSKAISDAMLKMLEERDWSQPMKFVEA